MTTRRPHRFALPLSLVGVIVLGAACSNSAQPAQTGPALVNQAHAAATQAGSVSYEVVATQRPSTADPHPPVETLVAQVSAPTAAESIRFSKGEGNLDVLLVNGTVYIRADGSTLSSALGLTDQLATKYAGTWISIASSDAPYNSITQTLTLDANIQAFLPSGPKVTVGPQTTLSGKRVLPLTGPAPTNSAIKTGVLRLYVAPNTHLPVAAGLVGVSPTGRRNSEVVSFKSWGKPVQATAPTGAVPYSVARVG